MAGKSIQLDSRIMQNSDKYSNKKIVVLMGGCGNRLFQLARAVDLQNKGFDVSVVNIEEFKLLYFFLTKIASWTVHSIWLDFNRLAQKLEINLRVINIHDRISIIIELFKIKILGLAHRLNLSVDEDDRNIQIGYFQAKNCVSTHAITMLGDCLALELGISSRPISENVIHIRAGDYDISDILSVSDVRNFLTSRTCLCITDDSNYVKRMHPEANIILGSDPYSDFIQLCSGSLIFPSRSTFSFWACVVATRTHQAKIWKMPEDPYWFELKKISTKFSDIEK